MTQTLSSEQKVREALENYPKNRKNIIKYLYNTAYIRKSTLRFIHDFKIAPSELHAILTEAILIFHKNILNKTYKGGNVHFYFCGICRNLCRAKAKERDKQNGIADNETLLMNLPDNSPEELATKQRTEQQNNAIEKLIAQLSAKCQKLLSHYHLSRKLKDVAKDVGYKNEHSAGKEKRKCLGRLRKSIKNTRHLSELFKDFL